MWKIVFSAIFSATLMFAAVMFDIVHVSVVLAPVLGGVAGVLFSLLPVRNVVRIICGIVLLPVAWFVSKYSAPLGFGLLVAGLAWLATVLGGYVASYFPEEY